MAQSPDPNVLAQDAQCLECGLPPGMQGPVIIWLLAQIAGVSTDPTFLAQQAQCIECGIPPGMYLPVMIWLLTQISSAGGGGAAQLVTYTSGTPANPSNTNAPALAYDPTGNLPTLGWNIGTQTWQ